ncbi:hypothetical protein DMB66_22800 [Actinoplanes sp. ATCC 53533]|uniref:serine/threonine-protein kinase n=1 Tax=Actinoplanes sp. ATCC 53533 TaxID=1288362 RepID=UPI000F7AF98F|nr:serine/threonine-protein kinase [Actinoplanes sp. ATCC 53533]RSM62117.1 hypothetical protein DMB66_22800 [Actinoplanes sp. ATCC 53533]
MNVEQDLVGGRYRLLEIIGAGGMGRVWLADDELLRRRVAVKEIGTPAGVGSARLLDAQLTTIREARAAARLDHPGVVGIYDVVRSPDRSWIIMEYVESRSLDAVVREDGPLSHREAARIGLGVLAALRAAHRAGVLHRDVKPHNVLLATDGRVVLTDFGLAKIKGTEHGSEPLMASPYFVAPERLGGDDAGEAADLWSLGATLYAAVEGQAPFQRPTIIGSLTVMMTEPPDPARFPGPLTPIIDGLLIKDPAHRMTAEDAQSRLRWVADHAVGIFPMRAGRRRTPTPAGSPAPHTSAPGTFTPGRSTVGTATPSTLAPARPTPAPAAPEVPMPGPAAPGTAVSRTSALSMSMILGRLDDAGPVRRGIARGTKIALIAAAILLAGSTGTALAVNHRTGATPAALAPTTVASAGPVAACAAGGQAVTGKTESRGYAVPAGWLWHSDPTGFDVAVPQGWARSQDGTAACFRDPGGSRSFRVDASARLAGSALPYWRGQEQNALTAGKLPGYQRVTVGALPGKQDGAVWEFTWQPEGEPARRHERRLLFPIGDERAYLVEWTTPEQDWTGTEPYLQLVLASLS